MDILAKYEKENPSIRELSEEGDEHSLENEDYLIGLVIRLSQGKIKNTRQALFILLFVARIFYGASILILFLQNRNTAPYHKPIPVKGYEFNEIDWPPRPQQ